MDKLTLSAVSFTVGAAIGGFVGATYIYKAMWQAMARNGYEIDKVIFDKE